MGISSTAFSLPERTKIGYCAWGVFRNKEIFGDDVNVFRPERWLEEFNSTEKIRERELTMELIFGYGRWQCLGKNVAMIKLNKVFVEVCGPESPPLERKLMVVCFQLLRRFELELVDRTKPWHSFDVRIFM